MQVLVIPDCHLKPYMYERALQLMDNGIAEQAVSLMDIPDDWRKEFALEEYEKTYDAAIAFAKKYPNSLWCYGNHDLCYLWNERESGYSAIARNVVCKKLTQLSYALTANNPIRYLQKIDNVLFSHGGISANFIEMHVEHIKDTEMDSILEVVNELGHGEMWKDNSPIWLRPQYANIKLFGEDKYLQIVGHTPMEEIDRSGNLISCDVFSTYQNGQPIGTEQFLVIDTVTWDYYGIK